MSDKETAFYAFGYLLPFGLILLVGLAASLVMKGNRPDKKFVWWPTLVALFISLLGVLSGYARANNAETTGPISVHVLNEGNHQGPMPKLTKEQILAHQEWIANDIKDKMLAAGGKQETSDILVVSKQKLHSLGEVVHTDVSFAGIRNAMKISGVRDGVYFTVNCYKDDGQNLVYNGSTCQAKVEELFGIEEAVSGAQK